MSVDFMINDINAAVTIPGMMGTFNLEYTILDCIS